MQKQSWDGQITRLYESQLGLHGGYARKINRNLPSSINNSEYVKSDDYGLWIVARGGRRVKPIRTEKELHYGHAYGNVNSAAQLNKKVKAAYAKRLSDMRRK